MLESSRRGTMSRSWVVTGAPWATTASNPTTMKSTPLAASGVSRLSRLGESIAELLDHLENAIVLLDAFLWRERERLLDERDVDLVLLAHARNVARGSDATGRHRTASACRGRGP